MPPELADGAFAHALAILGDEELATEVAVLAVRRGGRSRSTVLAHARHAALLRAERQDPPDLDVEAPQDLIALALALARSRPPLERAVIDLDTRHGLDRGGLARVLGMGPTDASALATETLSEWERSLDPGVLAHLGAGSCAELAEVLEGLAHPPTVADLLAMVPAVRGHVEDCSVCRDRTRAMVSARSLVGQLPVGAAPEPVRVAARNIRLRRPASAPPGLSAARHRPSLVRVAVVSCVAAAVVAAGFVAIERARDRPSGRVEALTQLPPGGSALVAVPDHLTQRSETFELTNVSERAVTWRAAADVEWLSARPSGGLLRPGASALVGLRVLYAAPEGELRASLTIAGDDGSTALVRIETVVERVPDLALSVEGCAVTARVEDEGEVTSVVLHIDEQAEPMTESADGYVGTLPERPAPYAWFVTASDARGNVTRTTEAVHAPGGC